MFSLSSGDLEPANLVTRRVDEWLLSGSCMAAGVEVTWGPHPPQISALHATHLCLTGDVHGLPTKYFQHGQALLLRNLPTASDPYCIVQVGNTVLFICGTPPHLTCLISPEIAVTTDSQTSCWNVLVWVSGQL